MAACLGEVVVENLVVGLLWVQEEGYVVCPIGVQCPHLRRRGVDYVRCGPYYEEGLSYAYGAAMQVAP